MDRVLAEGMTLTTTYDGETIAYFKIAKESVGTIRRLYDEYHDCKALDMGTESAGAWMPTPMPGC